MLRKATKKSRIGHIRQQIIRWKLSYNHLGNNKKEELELTTLSTMEMSEILDKQNHEKNTQSKDCLSFLKTDSHVE